MGWPSLDNAFQRISLRPEARRGSATVKVVALLAGANSSWRSLWSAATATTEARRAASPNSSTTLGGEAASTEPLAGSLRFKVEWARAARGKEGPAPGR